jgi:hypothetical protein
VRRPVPRFIIPHIQTPRLIPPIQISRRRAPSSTVILTRTRTRTSTRKPMAMVARMATPAIGPARPVFVWTRAVGSHAPEPHRERAVRLRANTPASNIELARTVGGILEFHSIARVRKSGKAASAWSREGPIASRTATLGGFRAPHRVAACKGGLTRQAPAPPAICGRTA